MFGIARIRKDLDPADVSTYKDFAAAGWCYLLAVVPDMGTCALEIPWHALNPVTSNTYGADEVPRAASTCLREALWNGKYRASMPELR